MFVTTELDRIAAQGRYMSDRYSDEWIASLLDPDRRRGGLTARELLDEAGLRPGVTVVDYGCGPGLVTLQAADVIGAAGKVYALDIHEGMVSLVGSRAAEAGLANVMALLNDGAVAPVPDGVADLITCTLVFHYKESPSERQALAVDLARMLKPGGCAMIVQWTDRVPAQETHDHLTTAGLECDWPFPEANGQYRVRAAKPL